MSEELSNCVVSEDRAGGNEELCRWRELQQNSCHYAAKTIKSCRAHYDLLFL